MFYSADVYHEHIIEPLFKRCDVSNLALDAKLTEISNEELIRDAELYLQRKNPKAICLTCHCEVETEKNRDGFLELETHLLEGTNAPCFGEKIERLV